MIERSYANARMDAKLVWTFSLTQTLTPLKQHYDRLKRMQEDSRLTEN